MVPLAADNRYGKFGSVDVSRLWLRAIVSVQSFAYKVHEHPSLPHPTYKHRHGWEESTKSREGG